MRVAVVGAGAAGLTAAFRLQQVGHDVEVYEAAGVAGGRTRTEHLGPGHWADTGAGWLASFYPRTLALLDELRLTELLRPMPLRGGGELMIDGAVVPFPSSLRRIVASSLIPAADKARFFAWMARLFAVQRGDLAIDRSFDDVGALEALSAAGEASRERIVRPLFEGPFFSRLEEMSATLLRSWLRVLAAGSFFQVDGGMDAPWRRLAELLGVRTSTPVERVVPRADGAGVTVGGVEERFDGCVVAVPAPLAADLVDGAPGGLAGVRYAAHVRLYAARRGAGPPRSSIHVFPNDLVATVELGSGRWGSWGMVPDDWCWALVCSPASSSGPLIEADEAEVSSRLWAAATAIDPRLFDLDRADVVRLVRWPHAVPIVGRGYYRVIDALTQRPPIVYAGDWLVQPCIEGAVRSGEAAAARFPPPRRGPARGGTVGADGR